MTERLYYDQQNLVTFEARVVEVGAEGFRVYLDRSAFYPASGGQPFDRGTLAGVPVVEVAEEEDGRVAHVLGARWDSDSAAEVVRGEVDGARRRDHQEQHTGQHLLSAVLAERWGIGTLSFHMGEESSTIDVAVGALTEQQVAEAERIANEEIRRNRPVRVSYEDAQAVEGLRKASERTGVLRIVTIEGLDRSACGGTHVASTGEIGALAIRKIEKVRGSVRIEFLCGARAQARARRDYEALAAIAKGFTVGLDQAASQVEVVRERLAVAEKTLKKLSLEEALRRGREWYGQAGADEHGRRMTVRRVEALGEEARLEGQGFTSGERAAYVAVATGTPAVMVALSADWGESAAALLKPLLEQAGGRGGGTAALAQGSVPTGEAAETVAAEVERRLRSS